MDKDQMIAAIARLLAGLAVPVSMEVPLGAAGPAWTELHQALIGFGWATPGEYESAIRGVLDGEPARRR